MKYFTINELCKSSEATKKGIANVPSAEERQTIRDKINQLENLL